MDFDVTQFLANLERAAQAQLDAAAQAAGEVAEMVMAESKEICPVSPSDPKHPYYTGHPGFLRDSGTVLDPVVTNQSVSVELGYNTPYAAIVHERPASHSYPGSGNPNGEDHYLEKAIIANRGKFGPHVAEAMRGALPNA